MISTENKLNIAAGGAGALGVGSLAFPHLTPNEWSFVHHNEMDFTIAGIGLLLLATGLLYAKRILPPTQEGKSQGLLIFPNKADVAAGRAHDRRRAQRKMRHH